MLFSLTPINLHFLEHLFGTFSKFYQESMINGLEDRYLAIVVSFMDTHANNDLQRTKKNKTNDLPNFFCARGKK